MYKKIWLDNVISLEVIHDYTRSSPCVIFCISNSISISIKLSRIGENEVEFEKKKKQKLWVLIFMFDQRQVNKELVTNLMGFTFPWLKKPILVLPLNPFSTTRGGKT